MIWLDALLRVLVYVVMAGVAYGIGFRRGKKVGQVETWNVMNERWKAIKEVIEDRQSS